MEEELRKYWHLPKIAALSAGFSPSRYLWDEIVDEARLQLFLALQTLEPERYDNVESHLIRVLKYRIIDFVRSQHGRKERVILSIDQDPSLIEDIEYSHDDLTPLVRFLFDCCANQRERRILAEFLRHGFTNRDMSKVSKATKIHVKYVRKFVKDLKEKSRSYEEAFHYCAASGTIL